MIWKESDGSAYPTSMRYIRDFRELSRICIGGNNAAIGSVMRQRAVEVFKHDEDYDLKFATKNYRFRVEYKYKADADGGILHRLPIIRRTHKACVQNFSTTSGRLALMQQRLLSSKHLLTPKPFDKSAITKIMKDVDMPRSAEEEKLAAMLSGESTQKNGRELRPGCRFASRAGDKGVIGEIWPNADMPVDTSGKRPDIIASP
jgi:DNA-directed RNA polymerase beta subunit